MERPVIVERPIHNHQPAPIYETGPGSSNGGFNGISGSAGNYGGYGGQFYKKELNLNSALKNFPNDFEKLNNTLSDLQGSSYSPSTAASYHTPRADGYESCACVPIDQCASYDIIGRKEGVEGYGKFRIVLLNENT